MKDWYTSHPHLFIKRPYYHSGCDSHSTAPPLLPRQTHHLLYGRAGFCNFCLGQRRVHQKHDRSLAQLKRFMSSRGTKRSMDCRAPLAMTRKIGIRRHREARSDPSPAVIARQKEIHGLPRSARNDRKNRDLTPIFY